MQALNRKTAGLTSAPPTRILQFGGGNFLRAYFDWMVELMNERTDFNGGVIVIKPTSRGDYRELRKQDGLFHVMLNGIQRGHQVTETRLVTCISKVIHPYDDYREFLDSSLGAIAFVVSNTTEAGIRFLPEPLPEDRCSDEYPGKLTQWLFHRFSREKEGCHLIPLELIEDNGARLKSCVLQYARHWELGDEFIKWIHQKNHFYDTLVDRIVSGFPPGEEELWKKLGYRDKLLVAGEYYHSLIIKAPSTGIPGLPLGEAGVNVTYTDDLAPYRERKVRLLNGAHTAIVPTGYLAGLDTVGEVIADREMNRFLEGVLYDEIIPCLPQQEGELKEFAADVLDRFRNPSIQHRLLDISLNGTTKFQTRLLPSLLEYHRKFDQLPPGIVRALAAMIVFYRGERGEERIPLRDAADRIEFFQDQWAKDQPTTDLVSAVLGRKEWWGKDLNGVAGLTQAVTDALKLQLR